MQDCSMTREAVKVEAEKFADYWHGVAGAKGRKADWPATWRNWCRNAKPAATQRNGKPILSADDHTSQVAALLGFPSQNFDDDHNTIEA